MALDLCWEGDESVTGSQGAGTHHLCDREAGHPPPHLCGLTHGEEVPCDRAWTSPGVPA